MPAGSCDAAKRRLLGAVIASVALHALVLGLDDRIPPRALLVPALQATLRMSAQESRVTSPQPAAKPGPRRPLPPEPKSAPKPLPRRVEPAAERPPQLLAPSSLPTQPEVPAPAARDEPRRTASAAAPAERPPAGAFATDAGAARSVDEDGLRQLRFALAGAVRQFKHYPMVARERGWSGAVEIRVALFMDGRAPAVSVGRSSGHEVLDRQAREMVLQALNIVTLPPAVAGREFATEVEVRFDLRAE